MALKSSLTPSSHPLLSLQWLFMTRIFLFVQPPISKAGPCRLLTISGLLSLLKKVCVYVSPLLTFEPLNRAL
jgi:hypothetical protein